jgi:hypothetical protein
MSLYYPEGVYMPSKVLKKYAEDSGKTIAEVETIWDEAKKEADVKFKVHDEHYWSYVNSVTRKKLGLDKNANKPPAYRKW